MNWLSILFPTITLIIGFALSEYGKISFDRRQDKKYETRKINRLLFFLLELRFKIIEELRIETSITSFLSTAKTKLEESFGSSPEEVWTTLLPFIREHLKNYDTSKDSELTFLEENIDNVLLDLAELYPVFAYELNGQHKIKDRLSAGNKYIDDMKEYINQLPFNFEEWIKPQLTQTIATDLSDIILKISTRTTPNLRSEVIKKIKVQDEKENKNVEIEITRFLNQYIEQIKNSVPEHQNLN